MHASHNAAARSHCAAWGIRGSVGDGEKFAQPQLPCWGPGPSLSCTSWPQLFRAKLRVCGELTIQVLAPKRAQDATLSFPRLGILCAWDTTEINLLSEPFLALETDAPPPKHPLEATLGAAGGPAPSPHPPSAAPPRTRRRLCLRPSGAASDLGSEGRRNRLGGPRVCWEPVASGKGRPQKEKDLRTTGQEPSCIDGKRASPPQSNSAKHHALWGSGPSSSFASRQARAQDPPPQQGMQSSERGCQEASVRLQGVRNCL